VNIHDVYRPFLRYFRSKRMRHFQTMFCVDTGTRILDVGGDPFNWSLMHAQPCLTVVNIELHWGRWEVATSVVGDGRCLPFRDQAFEVVFSNSVIEHVGGREGQEAFAREIRRVGQAYYVQTPNRWFPVEPHWLTPGIHFLPKTWQVRLLRNFSVWGLIVRPTAAECERQVAEVRLLGRKEMRRLFPDAEIQAERVCGFSKSLIAMKRRT
jgi:Methyltransferase domain